MKHVVYSSSWPRHVHHCFNKNIKRKYLVYLHFSYICSWLWDKKCYAAYMNNICWAIKNCVGSTWWMRSSLCRQCLNSVMAWGIMPARRTIRPEIDETLYFLVNLLNRLLLTRYHRFCSWRIISITINQYGLISS